MLQTFGDKIVVTIIALINIFYQAVSARLVNLFVIIWKE